MSEITRGRDDSRMLRMSRKRILLALVASAAFVAVGGVLLAQIAWVGWLSIVFGGAGFVGWLLELITPSWLLLNADGFTSWRPFTRRRISYQWISCGAFETVEFYKRQNLVVYVLDRRSPDSDRTGEELGVIKYISAGYGGLAATQLSDLMNGYRNRASQL